MRIRYSYKFLPYKRKGYEVNGVAIRMRITLRSQKPIDISTGFIIPISQWDSQRQMVESSHPLAEEINRTILQWTATLSEIISRYELIEKRIPDRGEMKDLFNDMVGHKTPLSAQLLDKESIDFFNCFDIFTKSMGKKNQWTASTYEKFSALRQHLLRFDHLLSFHTLSEKKLQAYVDYLLQRGMRNTTIAKNLAFLRWFLRWSYNNDYYKGNLHNSFKPKFKGIAQDKEIVYLTHDELTKLEEHIFSSSQRAIEQVRDVFLFCCYSGLRYSDVAKLKRSDIKEGYIVVVTKKTSDGLHIELNRHTKAILDKYKDRHFEADKALPIISNMKMNIHLKTLGKVCDLSEPTRIVYFKGNKRLEEVFPKWQLLTTHVARRTFVVTALRLGIPAEVIMKWTGHSRYEAMKPYVAIVDDLKRISMEKFNEI